MNDEAPKESPAFTLYIDPGDASKETLREVFESLSDLHIAHGGDGLEFKIANAAELHEAIVWQNGMLMALDQAGDQIPELQGEAAKVIDRLLAAAGVWTQFYRGVWHESLIRITRAEFELQCRKDGPL